MLRHTRQHIISQRKRVIAKRLRLLNAMCAGPRYVDLRKFFESRKGRYAKYNLVCSCWACRDPKYREKRGKHKQCWKKESCMELGEK